MTHYYFDVKNGTTSRDHQGAELSSDSDAIARGRAIAERVGSEAGPKDHACHISIIREDGQEVMRLQVGKNALGSAPGLKKIS